MIFRILVLALLIFWGVWVFNSCEQNGAEIENGTDQEDMVNDYEDTEDILDTDEEDQMEDTEDTEGSEDQMEDEDNKEDNDKVDEAFLDRTEYRGSHVRYDDKKDKDNKKPGTTTKKPVVKKPMKNTGASMGTEKGTQDSKNTTKSDTTTWKPEPSSP